MAKRITVTARGNKLDFDALRKSNPNTKPVIAGKKKESAKALAKKVIPPARVQRINATVPAPIPPPVSGPILTPDPVVEVIEKAEEPVLVKKSKTKAETEE